MSQSPAVPPPLPPAVKPAGPIPVPPNFTGALPVLDFNPVQRPTKAAPTYGCALGILGALLGIILVILILMVAAYQSSGWFS